MEYQGKSSGMAGADDDDGSDFDLDLTGSGDKDKTRLTDQWGNMFIHLV